MFNRITMAIFIKLAFRYKILHKIFIFRGNSSCVVYFSRACPHMFLLQTAQIFTDNDYIIGKLLNSYFIRQIISGAKLAFMQRLSETYIKSGSLFENKRMFAPILCIYLFSQSPVGMVTQRIYRELSIYIYSEESVVSAKGVWHWADICDKSWVTTYSEIRNYQ